MISIFEPRLDGASPLQGALGFVRDPTSWTRLTAGEETKVVRKPWGEERWLVHDKSRLVLKVINLVRGTRTSLQLHDVKEEVNLVLAGRLRLHYGARDPGGLVVRDVEAGGLFHIRSGTVHRVEALTDVVMMEVSTAEVDDVTRLADDWERPDGRIEDEHRPGKT